MQVTVEKSRSTDCHNLLMPPFSSNPTERCCVLLQAPFPLSLIVRIRVTARGPLAEAQPPPNGSSQDGGHAETALAQASAVQLCRKLNQEWPGGLLVAVPGTTIGECQVLCLKVGICLYCLLSGIR